LFWAVIFLLAIGFTLFNQDSLIHNINPSSTKQIVFTTCGGSDSKSNPAQAIITIRTSQGKTKKIDIITHRRLEKFFPDWQNRMDYQESREKVYKAAMIKRREALKSRQKEDFGRTKNEQDAIDYFSGTGFYKTHQDPSIKPNIFDTRQSFLIKMHNKKMRMDFVKSLTILNYDVY
jgi:hypothetical protein